MNIDKKVATRQSYGEKLAELGEKNSNIVVLDADLSTATKTNIFAKKFPDRFINVGIAEQNMMGIAAGLSTFGKIPFVSTFAVFAAGRAYDQIRNSIAYPKLNVKICATHQMIEDISLMRTMPNMKVMCTSDDIQTRWAVEEISKIEGPVYLRLCRLATPIIYQEEQPFEFGKGIQIGDGTDGTIIATGVTVSEALKAQGLLEQRGVFVRVVDIHTIKPIDKELIVKCAKETKKMVTVEDHNIIGGLGSSVCEVLSENYPVKVERLGIKDVFGRSGKAEELLHHFKIDAEAIASYF